jgi:hypothetical protein
VPVENIWQYMRANWLSNRVFETYDARPVPESLGNDLAAHVAMAENFRTAFEDGQWIPRLLTRPASLPDIPLFQFYGFMTGLLTLPFLMAGVKALMSIALAVALIRFLGCLANYGTGRPRLANPQMRWINCFANKLCT